MSFSKIASIPTSSCKKAFAASPVSDIVKLHYNLQVMPAVADSSPLMLYAAIEHLSAC